MVSVPRFTPALFRGTHFSHQWTSPPPKSALLCHYTSQREIGGNLVPEILNKVQRELELTLLIEAITSGIRARRTEQQH